MQPSLSDSISSAKSPPQTEEMLSSMHGTPVRRPIPPSELRNTPKRPGQRKLTVGVTDNPFSLKFGAGCAPFLEKWVVTVDIYLNFLQTGVLLTGDSLSLNQMDEQENLLPQRLQRQLVNSNHANTVVRLHCVALLLHFLFILWEVKTSKCVFDSTIENNTSNFLGLKIPSVYSSESPELPVLRSVHALLYIVQLAHTQIDADLQNNDLWTYALQLPDLITGNPVSSPFPQSVMHASGIHVLQHCISPLFTRCTVAVVYHLEVLLSSTQPQVYRHFMDAASDHSSSEPAAEYVGSMLAQPRIWGTTAVCLAYIFVAAARAGQTIPSSHDFVQKTCRILTHPFHGAEKRSNEFAFLFQHTILLEVLAILYPVFCFPALTDSATLAQSQFVLSCLLECQLYSNVHQDLCSSTIHRILFSWFGAVQPVAVAASALTTGDRMVCAAALASIHITQPISIHQIDREDESLSDYTSRILSIVPAVIPETVSSKPGFEQTNGMDKGNNLSAMLRKCSEGVGKAAHLPSLVLSLVLRQLPLSAVQWVQLVAYVLTTKYNVPHLPFLLHIPSHATTTDESWCSVDSVCLAVYKQLSNTATALHLRAHLPQDVAEVIQWMHNNAFSEHSAAVLACLLPLTVVFPQIAVQSMEIAIMHVLNSPPFLDIAKQLLRVCVHIRKHVLSKSEWCPGPVLDALIQASNDGVVSLTHITTFASINNPKTLCLQQLCFSGDSTSTKLFQELDLPTYMGNTVPFSLYHSLALHTTVPFPALDARTQVLMFLSVQATLIPSLEASLKVCFTQIPIILESPSAMTARLPSLVHRLWLISLYARRLMLAAWKTHTTAVDIQKNASNKLALISGMAFDGLSVIAVEYDKASPHSAAETLAVAVLQQIHSVYSPIHSAQGDVAPFSQLDAGHVSVLLRFLGKAMRSTHHYTTYTALAVLPTLILLPPCTNKVLEFYQDHLLALAHPSAHVRLMFALSQFFSLRNTTRKVTDKDGSSTTAGAVTTLIHCIMRELDTANDKQAQLAYLLLSLLGDRQREVVVVALQALTLLCKCMLDYTRDHPVGKEAMQTFQCKLWTDMFQFHTSALQSLKLPLSPEHPSEPNLAAIDSMHYAQVVHSIVSVWVRCMHGNAYVVDHKEYAHTELIYSAEHHNFSDLFSVSEEPTFHGQGSNSTYFAAGYPCQVVIVEPTSIQPSNIVSAYSIAHAMPAHVRTVAALYFDNLPNYGDNVAMHCEKYADDTVFLHQVFLSVQFGITLSTTGKSMYTVDDTSAAGTPSLISPAILLLPILGYAKASLQLLVTVMRCLQCHEHINLTVLSHVLAFINANSDDVTVAANPAQNALELAASLLHQRDSHVNFAQLCNSSVKSNVLIGRLDSSIIERAFTLFTAPQTLHGVKVSAARCLLAALYTCPNTCVKKGYALQIFFKVKALLLEQQKCPYLPKAMNPSADTIVFLHALPLSTESFVDTLCQMTSMCVQVQSQKKRRDEQEKVNTSLLADLRSNSASISLQMAALIALRHTCPTQVDIPFLISACQTVGSFFTHSNHYLRSTAVLTCGMLVQYLLKLQHTNNVPNSAPNLQPFNSVLDSYKNALSANQEQAKELYQDLLRERSRVFQHVYPASLNSQQTLDKIDLAPVCNILWSLLPLLGDTHGDVKNNTLAVFICLLENIDQLQLDAVHRSAEYAAELSSEEMEGTRSPQISGIQLDYPVCLLSTVSLPCLFTSAYLPFLRQLWRPYDSGSFSVNPYASTQPSDYHRNSVLRASQKHHFLFPALHWTHQEPVGLRLIDAAKQRLLDTFNYGSTTNEITSSLFSTRALYWLVYLIVGHVIVTVDMSTFALLTQSLVQYTATPHRTHNHQTPCSANIAILVLGCLSCVLFAQHSAAGPVQELPTFITDLTRLLLSATHNNKLPCFLQATIAAIRTSISNNPLQIDMLSNHTSKLEGSVPESLAILHALATHSFEAESNNYIDVIMHIASSILPKVLAIVKTNYNDENSLFLCLSLICRLCKHASEEMCVTIVNDILQVCKIVTDPSLYRQCITALSYLTSNLPTSHSLLAKLHESARADVMHPNTEVRRHALTAVTITLQSSYNNADIASGITSNVVQLQCDPDENIINTTVGMILSSNILQQETASTTTVASANVNNNADNANSLMTSATLPLSCMHAVHERILRAPHLPDSVLGVRPPYIQYTPVKSPEKRAFELQHGGRSQAYSTSVVAGVRKEYVQRHPHCVETLSRTLAGVIATAQPSLGTLHALSVANTLSMHKLGDQSGLYRSAVQLLSSTVTGIDRLRSAVTNAVKSAELALNLTEEIEIPALLQPVPTSVLSAASTVDQLSASLVVAKSVLLLLKRACHSIKAKLAAHILQHLLPVCADANAHLRQLAMDTAQALLLVNINSAVSSDNSNPQEAQFAKNVLLDKLPAHIQLGPADSVVSATFNALNTHLAPIIAHQGTGAAELLTIGVLLTPFINNNAGVFVSRALALLFERRLPPHSAEAILSALHRLILSGTTVVCSEKIYNEIVSKIQSFALTCSSQELELLCNNILHAMLVLHKHYSTVDYE